MVDTPDTAPAAPAAADVAPADVAPAPVKAAKPPPANTLAGTTGHVEPDTGWAILINDRAERRSGACVFGPAADIAAAIAAGDARAASQSDIEISAPFHYRLPAA